MKYDFEVGDRVQPNSKTFGDIWDDIGIRTIYKINGNLFSCEEDYCKESTGWHFINFKKIGGSMSKFEDLKQRINALQNGWDKEAEDILQEIHMTCDITISTSVIRVWVACGDGRFSFHTQYEKMTALKKALLWLLEKSDIKKDIVGQEIKADIEGKTYKVKVLGEI